MYSEEDINSAVTAGALSAEAADGLRRHVSKLRELPRSSEESFRLINSFNDIFVAIGIVILLVAVSAIGMELANVFAIKPEYPGFGDEVSDAEWEAYRAASDFFHAVQTGIAGFFVTLTAWPLAEFFTRKRRMALPSILLLLAFVGGVLFALFGLGQTLVASENDTAGGLLITFSAAITAAAAWLHWRRFQVPITIAAGAAAVAGTIIGLVLTAIGFDSVEESTVLPLIFIAGLCIFAFAMFWDMQDRTRTTRKSDVAFWLHLLAAPMIAHPIFTGLGVLDGGNNASMANAIIVLVIYVIFGLVALAIDRRALLVSALAYVLGAIAILFDKFGAVELTFALTALIIGSALLSLSAFWQPIRRAVVTLLPASLQEQLPPLDMEPIAAPQPASA